MNAPARIPRPRRFRWGPYMSGPEVARLFGVSLTTVSDWARNGKLTRTRLRPGANWQYAEGEVVELYRRSLRERAS